MPVKSKSWLVFIQNIFICCKAVGISTTSMPNFKAVYLFLAMQCQEPGQTDDVSFLHANCDLHHCLLQYKCHLWFWYKSGHVRHSLGRKFHFLIWPSLTSSWPFLGSTVKWMSLLNFTLQIKRLTCVTHMTLMPHFHLVSLFGLTLTSTYYGLYICVVPLWYLEKHLGRVWVHSWCSSRLGNR